MLRHGFKRIVLLNAHGGNENALRTITDELTPKLGAPIVQFTYWYAAAVAIAKILETQGVLMHACEAETSMMLAVRPELVAMDRVGMAKANSTPDVSRCGWRWRVSLAHYRCAVFVRRDRQSGGGDGGKGRAAVRGDRHGVGGEAVQRGAVGIAVAGLSGDRDPMASGKWQFWIDRGGTFTDIVARDPDGHLSTHKLLSENPGRYRDAAIAGIKTVLGISLDAPMPSGVVEAVKMGTTVATNALLERKGDRTLLVVNRGFADALRIGNQARPRLFDLAITLPSMLYEEVVEIAGRVGVDGEEIEALDEAAARQAFASARAKGIAACAIVLIHAWKYPEHERRLAELAREAGFTQVSASHAVSPLLRLIPRGDTTVVDAYLSPILRRYVDQVAAELGDVRLYFMQSNGGLADAAGFQGKDAILSGPAGGIVGAARTAAMAGLDHIIGFDMGGTSTDVALYAGGFERAFETAVAGVRMRAPMMAINTVAAGGGSILHFDGARFRVGPDSAGADPGPACYRRGGPLTVTDANVCVGKIQPRHFPAIFGPERRCTARCRCRGGEVCGAGGRDRASDRPAAQPASGGGRVSADRRRQHGECHQAGVGAEGP